MPEKIQKNMPEKVQKNVPEKVQKNMPEKVQKNVPEKAPKQNIQSKQQPASSAPSNVGKKAQEKKVNPAITVSILQKKRFAARKEMYFLGLVKPSMLNRISFGKTSRMSVLSCTCSLFIYCLISDDIPRRA